MAGGIFLSQNKRRPGAYINFKGISKNTALPGERGVVTLALPLSWGENGVTRITSTDYFTGGAYSAFGLQVDDAAATPITEALKYCSEAIVYRLDNGGTAAAVTQGNLTVTAKYKGAFGDKISISIEKPDSLYIVKTLVDGVEMNVQTGAVVSDLTDNSWVVFTGTGALTEIANKALSEGADGTYTETSAYSAYFNAVRGLQFNTMALLSDTAGIKTSAIAFIKGQRDSTTKKPQIVIKDAASADYEGVISTAGQGYKTADITVSPVNFVATIAGITAGASVVTSNTYKVLDGATEIIGEMTDAEITNALNTGKLVLSHRTDDTIVIEQDINTLQTLSVKYEYFKKNRVIRCLDDIAVVIASKFENSYIGKVNNNDNGRNLFKADIAGYLMQMQDLGAISNFTMDDIEITSGNDIDTVAVNLMVQPVDSMEKLYLTVNVGG